MSKPLGKQKSFVESISTRKNTVPLTLEVKISDPVTIKTVIPHQHQKVTGIGVLYHYDTLRTFTVTPLRAGGISVLG